MAPVPSPGAQVFWLVAEDPDNDPLTYGMSGPNAYFFTVTPNTGEVKLASALDYEVKSISWRGHGTRRRGWEGSGSPRPGGSTPCATTQDGLPTGPFSLAAADTLHIQSHYLRERPLHPGESGGAGGLTGIVRARF